MSIISICTYVCPTDLFDKNGLESDEHEESEDAVVPVLIQTPQAHTEHLEHKERSSGTLLEEHPEVGHDMSNLWTN